MIQGERVVKRYSLRNGKIIMLREGNGDDARKIIEYIRNVSGESEYLAFGKGEFNPTIDEEERFIEGYKQLENSLFLIAQCEDEIIGCLTFSGGSYSRIEHYGEFGITVLKKYWGFGIGRRLVEHLIIWARKCKIIRKINLKVRADNERAINLYESLGFMMEGTISRFFYHRDRFYDVHVMGLEIN